LSQSDKILENIKSMGYILVQPVSPPQPSFYELADKTILQAIVTVHYLIPAPGQPEGFAINASNNTAAFVPKDKRSPQSFFPIDPQI
jgi:hypothetical protein